MTTGWTSHEDAMIMSTFYDRKPEKVEDLTGERVANNIGYRVYIEWCCNFREAYHGSYYGGAFNKWVRDETHLALGKAGFEWDQKQNRFNTEGDFNQVYQQARKRVLEAVVKRAVELFRDWQGQIGPQTRDDTRNLRGSLEAYLS